MLNSERNQSEALLHELADASGRLILPYFRNAGAIDNKLQGADFDPVTEADRGAERLIREMIAARFPEDGVMGEEFPDTQTDAQRRWIIDPIDGTRAFIMGLPTWGTLIGLTQGGAPMLGMMNQPHTRERFWGGGESGASYFRDEHGERTLRTRQCATLNAAIVCTTTPDIFAPGYEIKTFERISRGARMRRFGGDCYAYCLLAMGLVDVVIEASLKPFDIIPLIPIIKGAGGVVSGWNGSFAENNSRIIACGDPHLHEDILKMLAA
ncbi:MAG: histidinol-phosphatase [Chitinophagales bacterium]|nr:histidinol-phosphatase [Hyphomicrobiales bacterium]